MDMKPVESSLLAAHGYDTASNTLAVQFKNGDTYHYAEVPPEVAEGLANAESAGKFFGQQIRPKFQGVKQDPQSDESAEDAQ